ncbi:MAG: uracil-DNA glycosylase family protein [Candidatus Bathyarchaeia archaeon]
MERVKDELMRKLLSEIEACRRCRLWRSANRPVLGEGSLEAHIMFIGEAPGFREDVEGRPFVGAAGRLLDKILIENQLDRRAIYITNIVKHRPPMNRSPKSDEVEACTPYLERQIQILKPRIIVTLGVHSARYILSKVGVKFKSIGEIRGKIYTDKLWNQVKIMPTLHPAAALYNPTYRATIGMDLGRLRHELSK